VQNIQMAFKTETRNPKPESRPKSESRRAQDTPLACRNSVFGFLSALGPSAFGSRARTHFYPRP